MERSNKAALQLQRCSGLFRVDSDLSRVGGKSSRLLVPFHCRTFRISWESDWPSPTNTRCLHAQPPPMWHNMAQGKAPPTTRLWRQNPLIFRTFTLLSKWKFILLWANFTLSELMTSFFWGSCEAPAPTGQWFMGHSGMGLGVKMCRIFFGPHCCEACKLLEFEPATSPSSKH